MFSDKTRYVSCVQFSTIKRRHDDGENFAAQLSSTVREAPRKPQEYQRLSSRCYESAGGDGSFKRDSATRRDSYFVLFGCFSRRSECVVRYKIRPLTKRSWKSTIKSDIQPIWEEMLKNYLTVSGSIACIMHLSRPDQRPQRPT